MKCRVGQLGAWLRGTTSPGSPIVVAGGLRGTYEKGAATLDALELSDAVGTTTRVLLPNAPDQVSPGSAATFVQKTKPDKAGNEKPIPPLDQQEANSDWWKGWTTLFTASTLLAPRVDPVRLADILHDPRLVRLFCDTNALANGAAEWLLQILPTSTQLLSSAIADKEIMSWGDQDKALYQAADAKQWEARLRFQLARRLTAFPPKETVIDRLSPDQNALMLAQGTDKTGSKSSQGDLLFVELARPLIREQPRQTRVLFLTGDYNVAYAATSALGPEHVLYANVDTQRDQPNKLTGRVLSRGFWHPARPLGRLSLPSISRLFWNLLSAFNFLIVKQRNRRWLLQPSYSVQHGGPSDWADPWLKVGELPDDSPVVVAVPVVPSPESGAASALPEVPPPTELTAPNIASTASEVPAAKVSTSLTNLAATTAQAEGPAAHADDSFAHQALAAMKAISSGQWPWLLSRPTPAGPKDVVSVSLRLDKRTFFELLRRACSGQSSAKPDKEVPKETFRALIAMQVLEDSGQPGRLAEYYDSLWRHNDRDPLHAELLHAHPGYRTVVEAVRSGRVASLSTRQKAFLPLLRALGQAAQLRRDSPLRMGDAPVAKTQLESSLQSWLPSAGAALSMAEACERALSELALTPVRFAQALTALWREDRDSAFEPKTAGAPEELFSEEVVELRPDGTFDFRPVMPSALLLQGMGPPVLFLSRRR